MARTTSPARILVVDSDRGHLDLLSRDLQREGFIAIEAASGADCVRIAQETGADVVVLDRAAPEVDGLEVCEALKGDPATAAIRIILVTRREDRSARAEGMRLGVSEFLPKPFSRRLLLSRINSQLAT